MGSEAVGQHRHKEVPVLLQEGWEWPCLYDGVIFLLAIESWD